MIFRFSFILTFNTVKNKHKAPGPQSLRPHCDLAGTKKIDNRREVAEVVARFYKGSSKVGDRLLYKISRGQSFEHAQKTGSY